MLESISNLFSYKHIQWCCFFITPSILFPQKRIFRIIQQGFGTHVYCLVILCNMWKISFAIVQIILQIILKYQHVYVIFYQLMYFR